VQNAKYFYSIAPNAVNRQIRQARHDKLAGVVHAAGSSSPGELLKGVDTFKNGERNTAGWNRAVLFLDVIGMLVRSLTAGVVQRIRINRDTGC
jgi:hypothetical protein